MSITVLLQLLFVVSLQHLATCANFLNKRVDLEPPAAQTRGEACAPLANKGTYFTVDVDVGTPGQRFSVVADTGSNTLIVPSCICQQVGYCNKRDRCFTGTNKSSTFMLMMHGKKPASIIISFGSGMIRGVIAQEKVDIGGLSASMDKGILLMTGKALDFGGSFEGIMGLGIPGHADAAKSGSKEQGAGAVSVSQGQRAVTAQDPWGTLGAGNDMHKEVGEAIYDDQPPGFLEQANITNFGICFNSGENGVLRMGGSRAKDVQLHSSVGTQHWGLGMDGISIVGKKETLELNVCNRSEMRKGQDTPCGAIPDSGTTMITGPADGVKSLLDSICDFWPRCVSNHTALQEAAKAAKTAAAEKYGVSPFEIVPWPKYKVLQFLLMDCEGWMDPTVGLAELPTLNFKVTGAMGSKQTLEMPGNSYVLSISSANYKEQRKGKNSSSLSAAPSSPFSVSDINSTTTTEEEQAAEDAFLMTHKQVCAPAFSVMEYNTQKNGPVWILGTPLFYEYKVGYNLDTKPPSLSLQPTKESPCGSCDEKAGLVTADTVVAPAGSSSSRPLRMEGTPRMPNLDPSLPL